jgi:hypothetical protein
MNCFHLTLTVRPNDEREGAAGAVAQGPGLQKRPGA